MRLDDMKYPHVPDCLGWERDLTLPKPSRTADAGSVWRC
jgi:hypothetical protein